MPNTKKRPNQKWVDEFIYKGYELARQGLNDFRIAKSLGVSHTRVQNWKKQRPAFGKAIEDARKAVASAGEQTFHNFVYDRLPPHLQKLWDRISRWEKEENGIRRIEAMLEAKGQNTRIHLYLHALIHCNFNASLACRKVGIARSAVEKWKLSVPYFSELVTEILWHQKNFCEGGLMALVAAGEPSAVIFANKTLNRDRGYNEKIDLNVSGELSHSHRVIPLAESGLTLEEKKKLLRNYRQRQKALTIDVSSEPVEEEE